MPRLEFSAPTKRAAYARSGGVCECHRIPWLDRPAGGGVHLRSGGIFYEHIVPAEIRADASLNNCAVLVTTCWKQKTARHDLPTIAKANRVRDRARGIKPVRPLPGGRRSDVKIRLRGRPVDRWTGVILRP